MNISDSILDLEFYGENKNLCHEEDRVYIINSLCNQMKLDSFEPDREALDRPLEEILKELLDDACARGVCEDSVVYRDLFDTSLMGILTPMPHEFLHCFSALNEENPKKATDYFYKLCMDCDYIRSYRVKKDVKWKYASEKFGELDITINLSKPEKDPKAIAAALNSKQSGYPKCLLCHENEGFGGNVSKPARQNLRQLPLTLAGEQWYVQYSPYVYYNEHCIVLKGEHTPMKITAETFRRALDFVGYFPHYFVGSNADLPIVGGSILTHDHMQGGCYTFPMERAGIEKEIVFKKYPSVKAGIVNWPMSVIRLSGEKESLIACADEILTAWRAYSDPDAFIFAETEGVPHNTITPIARSRGGMLELDLVLRNNITTDEHHLGVFHPHAELHHIKKENIGLIEVMGLAVLPARLEKELAALKTAILEGRNIDDDPVLFIHADWTREITAKHKFTAENADKLIRDEVGLVFMHVLEDAGVYKCTPEGRAAMMKFISTLN